MRTQKFEKKVLVISLPNDSTIIMIILYSVPIAKYTNKFIPASFSVRVRVRKWSHSATTDLLATSLKTIVEDRIYCLENGSNEDRGEFRIYTSVLEGEYHIWRKTMNVLPNLSFTMTLFAKI